MTMETLEALDIARARGEVRTEGRTGTIAEIWKPLHRLIGINTSAQILTVGHVVAYIGKRRLEKNNGEYVRGQTIRREVQALTRALRIAKRDRLIPVLPFDPEEIPKIPSDSPRTTQRGKLRTEAEIENVLANMSTKGVTAGHRNLCRCIMWTGLRLEEARRVQRSWLVHAFPGSEVKAYLHVPEEASKTREARTIPLIPEALDLIEKHAPFTQAKPNKSLKYACQKAGYNWVLTPRDLRTYFLSQIGALDPIAAQTLGGHANIATTGLYLKSNTDRAALVVVKALEGVQSRGVQSIATAPKT